MGPMGSCSLRSNMTWTISIYRGFPIVSYGFPLVAYDLAMKKTTSHFLRDFSASHLDVCESMLWLPIELSTWNGFAGELDAETIQGFRGKLQDHCQESGSTTAMMEHEKNAF